MLNIRIHTELLPFSIEKPIKYLLKETHKGHDEVMKLQVILIAEDGISLSLYIKIY